MSNGRESEIEEIDRVRGMRGRGCYRSRQKVRERERGRVDSEQEGRRRGVKEKCSRTVVVLSFPPHSPSLSRARMEKSEEGYTRERGEKDDILLLMLMLLYVYVSGVQCFRLSFVFGRILFFFLVSPTNCKTPRVKWCAVNGPFFFLFFDSAWCSFAYGFDLLA